MKKSKRVFLLFVFLTVFSLSSHHAMAHTTRSRELCGVINELDLSNHIAHVKSERSGKMRDLVLRKDTKFLKDWKRSSLDAVTPGVRACVYYRSPIFGKPFITRIVLLGEGDKCPPQAGGLLDRHWRFRF